MKRYVLFTIIVILLAIAANTRTYSGAAIGLAWDWGGFDILPRPAIFICLGNYDADIQHFTPNPIAPLFHDLLVDC